MAYPINAIVIDLSHWDSASDYNAVKNDGIYGCIYKATEGTSYTDPTYVGQQHAAKEAGLRWGTYHFANSSDVNKQIDNFMRFASPDPDELFSLDWEDNGGDTMSLNDVKTWITQVEKQLGREGQCVLYSGNTAKEKLGDNIDTFLGARRLWLSQYGSTPSWQKSWNKFWLWQYTDGRSGPQPHSVDGVGNCDISSYDNTADQLVAEWATGSARPSPPLPPPGTQPVTVLFAAPVGVTVKVRQFTPGVFERRNSRPDRAIEGGIRKKRSRARNKR